MNQRRLVAPEFFLFVLCAQGCSKGPPVITGKITYRNEPVTTGQVHFVGEGKSRSALIAPDGTYTINDPPLGEVKVAVESTGSTEAKEFKPQSKPGRLQPKGSMIPQRYAKETTSGLVYTIKGSQTIDLDLAER
jgi:hypothetical protein